MSNSFLFDKLLPFSSKKDINLLNIFQVYTIRFGIGHSLAKKICFYTGTYLSTLFNNYRENDINYNIKYMFIVSQNNLDEILEKKMLITLQENIDLYSYRGNMYKNRLPINGQRRKSNSSTCKRIRPIK